MDKYKKAAQMVWDTSPAGTTFGEGLEPGTQAYFETVLQKRTQYEFSWLPQLIPFENLQQKKVIEIGCGVGYDAYTLCQHGADYFGIDIAPSNPGRTRTHLGFYGYTPKVVVGDAENLMFPDSVFDAAFSNGVLHHTPDIARSFREIQRVLKPEADFWMTVYNKNSIFNRLTKWLGTYLLQGNYKTQTYAEHLSQIEFTTGGERPLVRVFSVREIKMLLQENGFTVKNVWIRKLTAGDLPTFSIRGLWRLWHSIPAKWLDWIGKHYGWYILCHAVCRK
jgi:ubiquinone/menaquinone biosynthesis C-methylase UbiE